MNQSSGFGLYTSKIIKFTYVNNMLNDNIGLYINKLNNVGTQKIE